MSRCFTAMEQFPPEREQKAGIAGHGFLVEFQLAWFLSFW
jgi:hypothetical protein